MTCTACGSANRPGAKFCAECGAALAAACPGCGAPVEVAAKFCAECGTRVGSAGPVQAAVASLPAREAEAVTERRVVSVLFADLVDFTRLAEGRDPEAVREILSRYFDTAREVVGRYGGTIEKFIGDAVMAVWGAPVAHEDDAERAVRAAIDLVGSIRTLGGEVEADLRLRAGVLTGEAAVTVGATNQGLVAGDLVNTAARLQSVASPETVLVGEETRRATAEAIAYEAAGDAVLKGKSAPVAAFRALRVVGKVRGVGRSEGLEPPFVGRETEFRLLREQFHATGRDRKARLVSLTGQGGIGKSRLAWEFNKYIDGVVEEVWWHQGRSPSYGEGITFWALGEMIRKRAGVAETDDEATLRAGLAAALAEHVADPAERTFVEASLLALLGLAEAPPGGRERLFAGWRTFFERIAESGTVALVFEDLQWADDGLLDFVEHLLEWSRNFPIFILTLARPELLDRRPTWGGARSSTSLALSPLADEEMRALLAGLVPGLPDATVRSILARADGIPLYAVETVRMLVADGRLEEREGVYVPVGELGDVEVPGSLRALVAARLDGLPADLRPVVQDASILGQTFSVDALEAVTGLDRPVLEPRLRDLVRLEVLDLDTDPRSPERGQYGFVQALLREVAYETLARRDRRARHLAAAEYFAAQGDEELAGALATHYVAAYRAGTDGPDAAAVATRARHALQAAAERAAALGSPLQATAYLRDAIEIAGSPAEVAPLEERAARIADRAGRYAEATDHAARAAAAYVAAGDEPGELRSLVLQAGILSYASFAEGSALLRAIAPRLESSADPWVVARGALSGAAMRVRAGEDADALPLYERALSLAEKHGFTDILLSALSGKATLYTALGRNVEAGLLLAGVVDRAERTGDVETVLHARSQLAFVLIDDDPKAALVVARDGLALARRLGMTSMALFLGNVTGRGGPAHRRLARGRVGGGGGARRGARGTGPHPASRPPRRLPRAPRRRHRGGRHAARRDGPRGRDPDVVLHGGDAGLAGRPPRRSRGDVGRLPPACRARRAQRADTCGSGRPAPRCGSATRGAAARRSTRWRASASAGGRTRRASRCSRRALRRWRAGAAMPRRSSATLSRPSASSASTATSPSRSSTRCGSCDRRPRSGGPRRRSWMRSSSASERRASGRSSTGSSTRRSRRPCSVVPLRDLPILRHDESARPQVLPRVRVGARRRLLVVRRAGGGRREVLRRVRRPDRRDGHDR